VLCGEKRGTDYSKRLLLLIQISELRVGQRGSVLHLLRAEGLPTSDIEGSSPRARFLVAQDGEAVLGSIALEQHGNDGLLRSLVVSPAARRLGVGTQLVEAVERLAREAGVETLYLLTESAGSFFAKREYAVSSRDDAPESIRSHPQFRSLCPSTAALMGKRLARTSGVYRVLFLCTGNSARSIMAEVALRRWGNGKFQACSAGSMPKGEVHPLTLALLQSMDLSTDGLRSKSWDEFAGPQAIPLDFVFTVCDNAAGEICPVWPGQPVTAHWGVEDPAAATGSDRQQRDAFTKAFRELEARIKLFVSLPLASIERSRLQQRVEEIGRASHEAPMDRSQSA
jgi:protein-tyrosine-phosphatase/N-acetylglutamate synthase-like GNAT family acetyltransferase